MVDRFAVRRNFTSKRCNEPQDSFEKRCLTGAVRTQKAKHFPRLEQKAQTLAHDFASMSERQIIYLQPHHRLLPGPARGSQQPNEEWRANKRGQHAEGDLDIRHRSSESVDGEKIAGAQKD